MMCMYISWVFMNVYGIQVFDHFFYDNFAEPAVIAKSNIILDVKPWDDETGQQHL